MNPRRVGLRWTVLLLVAVAAVLVPFALWGAAIERAIEQWRAAPGSATQSAMLIVGLLASDVVLPIPSSIVAVAAGMVLGTVAGTLAVAFGMTLGCGVGWGLGRVVGPAGLPRVVGAAGVARLGGLARDYGASVLLATRAVPVLAEISVVAAGAAGMPLSRVLLPCVVANVAVASVYALAGDAAVAAGWPQLGILAGLLLPAIALGWAARRFPPAGPPAFRRARGTGRETNA